MSRTSSKPRPYGTFDLETDPFKNGRDPQAFCGALFDGSTTHYEWSETCARHIVEIACSERYKDWIFYAHNGGKFDFHFLLGYILQLYSHDLLEIMTIGSRIVRIKTPTCEFRDSFTIIPRPLKDIAHAEKKEIEIWKLEKSEEDVGNHDRPGKKGETLRAFRDHLSAITRVDNARGNMGEETRRCPREVFREEIKSYLYQDCHGLYNALGFFFEKYGQEITLASTCFKVLKNQFGMPAVRTDKIFDERFRRFYYAGRVQFFALGQQGKIDGEKRFSCVDINSAFPWAMTKKHWFSNGYILLDRPPKTNPENCFYEIVCDSDGALPQRTDSGIKFPVAVNSSFFVSGWELFEGIRLGLVSRVRYSAVFMPTEIRDFSDYVGHFYEMKKNAKGSERDFAKLFLNSAYGKFALNPREFRDVCITAIDEIPDPKKIELKEKGKFRFQKWDPSYEDKKRGIRFWQMPSFFEDGRKPMSFNNVATAASITACVRALLMRSISSCDGVLYCDTDSIIARDVSRLPQGNELGEWKLEKEMDALFLGGKKLYAGHDYRGGNFPYPKGEKEWKIACKGVRLSPEQICKVALGEEQSYTFDAPNYSAFSSPKYTTRRVNRDDKLKRK